MKLHDGMARHPIVSKHTWSLYEINITLMETVTVDDLKSLGEIEGVDSSAAVKRKLENLNGTHVRALFSTKKLAYSTSLIIACWALIGLVGYSSFMNHC